jgi:hypothetical protein
LLLVKNIDNAVLAATHPRGTICLKTLYQRDVGYSTLTMNVWPQPDS